MGLFDWLNDMFASGAIGQGIGSGLSGITQNAPLDPAAEVRAAALAEPPREQTPVTSALPPFPDSQNVGTHPVQNPAESQTPMGAPTGMNPDITIQRVSSTPVGPNAKPSLSKQLESLGQAGMKLAQAGTPQRSSGGGGMPTPQIHRGQPVSLIDLVFGNRNRNF